MAEIKKEITGLKNSIVVTVNEVDYTLQKLPTMHALRIRQDARTSGSYDDIKMYKAMLEHVVVSPRVTIDDFDDVIDLEELMEHVLQYQYKTRGK